jgi:Family of unknown function (DUF6082)
MAGNEVQRKHHRAAFLSARGWGAADAFKRAAILSALVVAVVAVLALVVVSPLALRQLDLIRGANWTQLSNIGQTYGAASALLTGLALIGVAGSMIFQVRTIQVSREQSAREQHTHLMEMTLANPLYQRCWGDDPAAYGAPDKYPQQLFVNLILSLWQNYYALGGFREQAMRVALAGLFRGEAGREFWVRARDVRLQTAQNRQDKRFCRIVEEEYQKTIATRSPAVKSDVPPLAVPSQRLVLHDSAIKTGATLLLGAMGGIAFRACLREHRR